MEITPFAEEHLDAAAELLAERHGRHLGAEPLLPAEVDYRAEIAALLDDGGSGAFTDGAYVLGRPHSPELWGPNIWVDAAGHATRDPELLRNVWAEAAAGWLEQGVRAHYALVPATDSPLVDAWFRLGFGAQQAYGVMEIPEGEWPRGVREATEADIEELVEIGPLLSQHQRSSPVFSSVPEQDAEAVRADVLDDFADENIVNLVYELDGRIVANFCVCPLPSSDDHKWLARQSAAFIPFAVTELELRGRGAGCALTDAAFAWARGRGHETIVADWRVTNLSASRFWPKRGFRTSFVRVHRWIG